MLIKVFAVRQRQFFFSVNTVNTIEKIEILFLILTVAKFTALLIFWASREECGLAQCMKEKIKGSEIFILHVLRLS